MPKVSAPWLACCSWLALLFPAVPWAVQPAVSLQVPPDIQRLTGVSEWEREEALDELRTQPLHIDDELVRGLLHLLAGNVTERRVAITALRVILVDSAKLSGSYSPPPDIRTAIVTSLAQRLDDGDNYIVHTAGKVLAAFLMDKEVATIFPRIESLFTREAQRAGQVELRISLLSLMGRCSAYRLRAHKALLDALHDPIPQVRRSVVHLLTDDNSPFPRGAQEVLDALGTEQDTTVRIEAMSWLSPSVDHPHPRYPDTLLILIVDLLRSSLASSPSTDLQKAAAASLGQLALAKPDLAVRALPDLVTRLSTSPSPQVKAACARAVGNLHEHAAIAVDELIASLDDDNAEVQQASLSALGDIGLGSEKAIERLRRMFIAEAAPVATRAAAARALGGIGKGSLRLLPDLRSALGSKVDAELQSAAVDAIAQIGPDAIEAEDDLLRLATVRRGEDPLTEKVVRALDKIQAKSSPAAALLANNCSRFDARAALRSMCKRNPAAIHQLVRCLDDQERALLAFVALEDAALELQEGAESGSLPSSLMAPAADGLRQAKAKIEAMRKPLPYEATQTLSALSSAIRMLEARLNRGSWVLGLLSNPWFAVPAFYLLLSQGVFWLAPLWLLSIADALEPIKVRQSWLGVEVNLGQLVLLRYHPRVLDAWVAHHIARARIRFSERPTVEERKVHIALLVRLDDGTVVPLTPGDLRPAFSQQQIRVLIWGEGGAGKTSLACQLARWAMSDVADERLTPHPMLPILVEEDLEISSEAEPGNPRSDFLNVLSGQLKSVTDMSKPISELLFESLLRHRRVLVIVDHLSEMSEAMRRAVRPEAPYFLPSALVVTARTSDVLGRAHAKKIVPLRIEGDRTVAFLTAYLSQRGKIALFGKPELTAACDRLARMGGQHNVTALLAKIYAEMLITQKESRDPEATLPRNIPELMLRYLIELNSSLSEGRLDDPLLQRVAGIVAWECLKPSLLPGAADRKTVLATLGPEGPRYLDYLESKLRLVRTVGTGHDQIRMTLDPLAEYLAAIYLVKFDLLSEGDLEVFERRVAELPDPAAVEGFLLAVKDTYLAMRSGAKESDPLPATIMRRITPEQETGAG